jgi:hypothetical protein
VDRHTELRHSLRAQSNRGSPPLPYNHRTTEFPNPSVSDVVPKAENVVSLDVNISYSSQRSEETGNESNLSIVIDYARRFIADVGPYLASGQSAHLTLSEEFAGHHGTPSSFRSFQANNQPDIIDQPPGNIDRVLVPLTRDDAPQDSSRPAQRTTGRTSVTDDAPLTTRIPHNAIPNPRPQQRTFNERLPNPSQHSSGLPALQDDSSPSQANTSYYRAQTPPHQIFFYEFDHPGQRFPDPVVIGESVIDPMILQADSNSGLFPETPKYSPIDDLNLSESPEGSYEVSARPGD